VQDWGFFSEPWQKELRLYKTRIRAFVFEHSLVLDQQFLWQNIIDSGDRLQDQLVNLCDEPQVLGITRTS
jgi:hypothetical protein